MNKTLAILLSCMLIAVCSTMSMAQSQADGDTAGPAPSPDISAPPAQPATPAEAAAPQPEPEEYKLQPDDIIRMQVFGEPDLSVEQAVNPSGYINIPLVGQIRVQDLTQDELALLIRTALSKYLVEPKVQLTLSGVRDPRVFVLGQVGRPGPVSFKQGQRIMEAIAGAGSYNEIAWLEEATLTHKGSQEADPLDLRKLFLDGDMSQNVQLKDGDTIFIPEDTKNKYFVLGEVMRPMMYRLRENVTVMDAITTAGGPTPKGTLKDTYIIRGDPGSPQRIKVDIGKLVKGGDLTQNIMLEPGDVVYVAESSKPDWGKIGNLLSIVVNSSYLFRSWGL
jgi:polysaccharide export outer membrane protein